MNKRSHRRDDKLRMRDVVPSPPSLEEEDVDEVSSMMGQDRTSVRGAMSDFGDSCYAGTTGADSAADDGGVGGGASAMMMAASSTRASAAASPARIGGKRGGGVRMIAGTRVGENAEDSTAAGVDGEGSESPRAGAGGGRSTLRIFRRWSDIVSRVSRSASSLLSQHSPNLNDILDGTGENPLEQPRRGVHQSIPEDACGPTIPLDGDDQDREVFELREEVALLKEKIRKLEEERAERNDSRGSTAKMRVMEMEADNNKRSDPIDPPAEIDDIPTIAPVQTLRPDQISRYSRQLLLNDGFGVEGQKQLLSSSMLVIGAGGIGSTVLLYLAAAGVGHITIVDYDCVEMSNLHRQVIHRDGDASKKYDQVGMNKALSAKRAMLALNPTLSCTALCVAITAENAMELVSRHDAVVDACDNPQTRYLLNDACILAGKPLVSGSAMGTEGQLTVYNHHPGAGDEPDGQKKRTACYRCLYPNPVPAEGCKSCSDNGVLGMVPGAIGVLQAVEAIKVVTGIGSTMHDRLLMYDSLGCSFLNVKKPPARPRCAICSGAATIETMEDSRKSLEDVRGPAVCAAPTVPMPGNRPLPAEQNVSCAEYDAVRKGGRPHVLLDVRVERQHEMCSLDGAVNLPLERLESELETVGKLSGGRLPVYCLCRRGIASAEAARIIQNSIEDGNANEIHSVYNVSGGLNSWARLVDLEFPHY